MKMWKWLLLLLVLLVGLGAIAVYSHYEKAYPSTENAYIDATAIRISSQIDGPVAEVHVHSQQQVDKGSLMVSMDAVPFHAALNASLAELALAKREVAENRAELVRAQAEVEDAKVHLSNAREQLKRLAELREQSYSSAQQIDDAEAVYRRAEAGLKISEAQLGKARARLTRDIKTGEDLLVQAASARVRQSRWALAQTQIIAPCTGVLESVNIHAGETVRAHNVFILLVCTNQFWVEANFKETQLLYIRPEQTVEIEVDMYPGKAFHGVVESISPASGTAFSLLPPENATGNWVKTTQRIPVKIRILNNYSEYPLRVGSSSKVRIDTRKKVDSA